MVNGIYQAKHRFHVRDYELGEDLTGVAIPEGLEPSDGVLVTMMEPEEWMVGRWYMPREEFLREMELCQSH